jgi:hypothetical protein
MLVFHPAGERHSQIFRNHAVSSFNVELGPNGLIACESGARPWISRFSLLAARP